jgi:oxygen-independent coproporphyrinogen-3 oxidase
MNALLEKYGEARVPRYTSYPTAPHFHDEVDAETYRGWLSDLGTTPDTRLSLYLHVPYCAQLCWYCGCNALVANRPGRVRSYASQLAQEIELVSRAIGKPLPVSHIHWGGGTPTMLDPRDFVSLMTVMRSNFAIQPDADIDIEVDPRTLDAAIAKAMAEVGVTRASLGIQDFTPRVQAAINRVQSIEDVEDSVEYLRINGLKNINFDMMYGLPHQTVADLEDSIDLAVSLRPDRFAVFGYAHVPWMKPHQRMIDESALPDSAERKRQADAATARLEMHGYRRIGLDHFARPGDPMLEALENGRLRRNFQGYTTDDANALIGLGVSAISALPAGYAQNTGDLKQWRAAIESETFATHHGVELTDDDHFRRAIIEALMCDHAVDLTTLRRHYGVPSHAIATDMEALRALEADGLVEIDQERISVTEAGAPYVRSIAACFDAYLKPSTVRHSQAV